MQIQLLPVTYEDDKERIGVDAIGVAFDNNGSTTDQNVSLKVEVPTVKDVVCDNPNRIQVIGSGHWSTMVQLLAPELVPNEKHTCRVHFLQRLNELNTVTAWKNAYGTPKAWSQQYGFFDPLIYRVHFGATQPAPLGSSFKHEAQLAFEFQ